MTTLSPATALHVPVQKQLLFEARERTYADTRRKTIMLWDHPPVLQPGTLPGLGVAINKHPQSRTWTFELYVKGTDVKLLDFILFSLSRQPAKSHPARCRLPPGLQADKKERSSLHLLEEVCVNQWLLSGMQTLAGSAYMTRKINKYQVDYLHHLHFDVKRSKSFPSMNYRECPAGSYRSQGHAGDIFHTIEYGSPYFALVPLSRDKWQANDSGALSVTVIGKTGEPLCRECVHLQANCISFNY